MMVGSGKQKKALRGYVIRAISHEAIRDVCKGFASRNPDDKIRKALDGHGIPGDLADIARTCHDLQADRHEADYNFIRRFTKKEAIDIVDETEEAHKNGKLSEIMKRQKFFLQR